MSKVYMSELNFYLSWTIGQVFSFRSGFCRQDLRNAVENVAPRGSYTPGVIHNH